MGYAFALAHSCSMTKINPKAWMNARPASIMSNLSAHQFEDHCSWHMCVSEPYKSSDSSIQINDKFCFVSQTIAYMSTNVYNQIV